MIIRYCYKSSIITPMVLISLFMGLQEGIAQSSNPGWIDDPSSEFNDEVYLMAVGSGATSDQAKNQAISNIAKRFESKVKVDEKYVERFRETIKNQGPSETQSTTQLITESSVQSEQNLRNVKIERTHESGNGRYYALALLHRTNTAELYKKEINRNRKSIEELLKKTENTDNVLEKLYYIKQAMVYAQMSDMLNSQRTLLIGESIPSVRKQLFNIQQRLKEVKDQCTVEVQGGEETPNDVLSLVKQLFQEEGFSMADDGDTGQGTSQPVLQLKTRFDTEPVDLGRENAEFVKWTFKIEAKDVMRGKLFDTYLAEGREGSVTMDNAKKRALFVAQKKIKEELQDFINNKILSF